MPYKKKTCLIISDENPTQEPRIRNFIFAMSHTFTFKFVTPTGLNDWPHVVLNQPFLWNRHHKLPLILRKPVSILIRIYQFVRKISPRIDAFSHGLELLQSNPRHDLGRIDLVFCTHPWMVPLAWKYARENYAKLVCDLFEYYPNQFPDDIQSHREKRLVSKQLVNSARFVDLFIVASEKFVPEYQNFMNAKFTFFPCAVPYRNTVHVRPNTDGISKIRLVHHGTANPSRKIENMIHSIGRKRAQYECDFFLIFNESAPGYKEYLHSIAQFYSNVNIREPVSPNQIIDTLSKYDAGIYILPPISKNQELLLPNKIFDFIQARLFILIGPSTGFQDIILGHNIGLVATNFSDDAVDCILDELMDIDWHEARQNLDRAAEALSLERMSADLKAELDRLMEHAGQ